MIVKYWTRDPGCGVRWVVNLLGAILVSGGAMSEETPARNAKQFRLVTEAEMQAFASLPPLAGYRPDMAAREKAVWFRGPAAQEALATRGDPKYALVPPELTAELTWRLKDCIRRTEAEATPGYEVAVDSLSIYEIRSAALTRLFPKFVFLKALVHQAQPGNPRASPPAGGVNVTFAISTENQETWEFPEFGTHARFGPFLRYSRVRLRHASEAVLVWDAFCALHNKRWFNATHREVDARTWWLNCRMREGTEHFFEVLTDADGCVLAGQFRSEKREVRSSPPI